MLEKISKDARILVDIYVNYDCDLEAPNLFERMVYSCMFFLIIFLGSEDYNFLIPLIYVALFDRLPLFQKLFKAIKLKIRVQILQLRHTQLRVWHFRSTTCHRHFFEELHSMHLQILTLAVHGFHHIPRLSPLDLFTSFIVLIKGDFFTKKKG